MADGDRVVEEQVAENGRLRDENVELRDLAAELKSRVADLEDQMGRTSKTSSSCGEFL